MKNFALVAIVSVLSPLAAFAEPIGLCQLWKQRSIENTEGRELLILARDLDVSGRAQVRAFVSNDQKYKLRILQTTARTGASRLQFNGYYDGVLIVTASTGSSGGAVSTSATAALPDGSGIHLVCSISE